MCIDVCVQFDSVEPVSCVFVCIYRSFLYRSVYLYQDVMGAVLLFSIFKVFGVSRCGIRFSAGRTHPSSSPVCREDPHPWQIEPFASARVQLPRILHLPWMPAGASYGAV